MTLLPQKNIEIAIKLINDLSENIYSESQVRSMANKANIEAWKSYKSNPDNIESVTIYAITEAIIGNIDKSIMLFENEILSKININALSKSNLILLFINYAQILTINKQYSKSLDTIKKIEHMFYDNIDTNIFDNQYILQVIFRIYFEHDFFSNLLEIIYLKQESEITENTIQYLPLIFKMMIFYKIESYNQTLICFNQLLEMLPTSDIEIVFEEIIINITRGAGHLTNSLSEKELQTLKGIKKLVYEYIESNKIIEEYDESIPEKLQNQYKYTLDELLEGFNGSKHEEISTSYDYTLGKEVW